MVAQERVSTLEDLRELESRPENADKRFELLNGVIYEVPTGTPLHAWIIGNFLFALQLHIRPRQLGFAFGDSVSYTLPNGHELIPDVSFVSAERQSRPFPDKFRFAPDLAVEIFFTQQPGK
jgi:Uma2 family endonuclease